MAHWYEPIALAQEAENLRSTQEQNRLAAKIDQMKLAEAEKLTGVKNFLASGWRRPTQQNTLAPQAVPNQPQYPSMGPRTPQVAPAQPPQYPSDEDLKQAIQRRDITEEIADGVRAERTQYEATQKQAYVQEKLKRLDMLSKSAVESGDNETFQQIAKAAQEDPDVAPFLPKLDSIKIPAKGEIETVRNYTTSDIQQIAGKHPQLGIDPDATPAGSYKLVMKNGRASKWEPTKDTTPKTAESMELDSLMRMAKKKFPNDIEKQEAWASNEALNRKTGRAITVGQGRIPSLQPVTGAFDPETGAPIIFNRRTGEVKASKVTTPGLDVASAKQDYAASTAALRDNEKRLTAITTFTNRIDKTIPIVEGLAKKYGNNFGGMLNKMRSNTKRGIGNTGDLKSLELALFALTGELTKTEMGSIGVAGASATQMDHMRSILSDSTNAKDIIAVLPTIKKLSEASKDAVKDVSDEIRQQRKRAIGAVSKITAKDIKEGQRFDLVIQGERRTGVKKNGKLVFDKTPRGGTASSVLSKYGEE